MSKRLNQFLKSYWPYMIIILFTTIIEWPQLSSGKIVIGTDTLFHYNRSYDTAMQIGHHNIQYWISMYGFHNSGRIVNAIYSPILAYILGAVLLICRTFFRFQILTDYVVPLLAGICLQAGFKLADLKSPRNKILIAFYPFTYQVFHWNISTNFTSIGAIVMPLIVGALINMLRNKEEPFSPLPFGILMGLVVQVHLITALQALMLCILIIIPAFVINKLKKRFFFSMLEAALITFALSFNIFGGMLELFTDNHVTPLYALNFDDDRSFVYTQGSDGQFMTTFMFIMVVVIFLMSFRYVTASTRYVGFLSIVFFILASRLLPWRSMIKSSSIIGIIQYPSRFLVPAVVLACFFMAMIFHDNLMMPWFRKTIVSIIALCLLFSVASNYVATSHMVRQTTFSSHVFPKSNTKSKEQWFKYRIIKNFRKPHLGRALKTCYQGTPDYLPLTHKYSWKQASSFNWRKNPSSLAYIGNVYDIYQNHQNATIHRKVVKHHIRFKINSKSTDITKMLIPVAAYQGTQVNSKQDNIDTNPHHCNRTINLPTGTVQPRKTTVDISYQANPADNIMVAIGIGAWIISLLLVLAGYAEMHHYLYIRDHYQ